MRTAHKLAIASEFITADMVSANEFPHLSQRYDVMAVPKIVINETEGFEGSLPEEYFVEALLAAVGEKSE